jgi:SAM-dependent methyltransferase
VAPATRNEYVAKAGAGVFGVAQSETLLANDASHWWFASKAALVSDALASCCAAQPGDLLVDVGAGAGGVTVAVRWAGGRKLGIDGSTAQATEGQRRHGLPFMSALSDRLPLPSGVASVVTLLDVIEHLPDPGPTLRDAHRVLRPDGLLVVTVPAHQWLWSEADEFLGHQRRYATSTLIAELTRDRFDVVRTSHIFCWLVPAVLVRRRLSHSVQDQLGLETDGPVISRLAGYLTAIERRVVARARLPLGTSLMAIAHPVAVGKPQTD